MAQTVANLTDVLKEAWTPDRIKKQFYDKNPFLDAVYKGNYEVSKAKIGEKAVVPIHKGRSGGYTSTTSAGGALNPADEQKVDSAEYTLIYHWFQVALETGVLNQATGGNMSAVVGKDLELQGAVADVRKQCMRQIVTAGDGIVAACDTGGASTTVELLTDSATSFGYQALRRGWLQPGTLVDIGTTSDTDSLTVGGTEITAVKKSATDPDITVGSSISTTSGTHFVYLANPNSATAAPPELNGLRTMIGSPSSSLGGLDPDTAGEEFWQPASVDTTTTVWSIDLALDAQMNVMQETGEAYQYILTSLKQQRNFYSYLQNQVRFQGETKMGAGDVDQPKWNGMEVHALPDVLDQDWYCLTLSDFVIAQGDGIPEPTWMSDLQGINKGLQWVPDTTGFKDAIVWPWQLGLTRRNSHAAAIGLTA